MPIPDYQTIMLPLLRLAGDGEEHSIREAVERLASQFKLTDDERREMLPSGQQARFDNRANWSRSYLKQAGLLETPRRGYFRITDRGREVLKQAPPAINVDFLKQFDDFRDFQTRRRTEPPPGDQKDEGESRTPEELIATAYEDIRQTLTKEILEQVMAASPAFFEALVVDVLVKMGYGGTRADAGQAVGRSGDGGIDGIIKEDRLGLDIIHIQAKRWEGQVGRPEIQKFAGALQGRRARKGVFITTSTFSGEAVEYAANIDSKIILIDGAKLADLMIDFNVGVTAFATYELKRIDADYFVE